MDISLLLEERDDDVVGGALEEELWPVPDDLLLLGRLQGAGQGLQGVGHLVVVEESLQIGVEINVFKTLVLICTLTIHL